MFEVFVLLCSVSNPQECVTFNDTHGLKDTKEQCKIRAIEMTRDLEKVITITWRLPRFKIRTVLNKQHIINTIAI